MFTKFYKDISGNFVLILAIVAPVLLGAIGICTDFAVLHYHKEKLQDAADATALASVRELSFSGSASKKSTQVQAIAKQYALANFAEVQDSFSGGLQVLSEIDLDSYQVKVNLTYSWEPLFAHYFGTGVTPIKVKATAELAGNALTCVLGLMEPTRLAKASIHLDDNSVLRAERCTVFSNSTSRYGLRADANAKLAAQTICSAGGVVKFGNAVFEPMPITDCPAITDPLAARKSPKYSGCDETNFQLNSDEALRPGVYCGGLSVSGSATAKLEPGIYVIKDGPLVIADNAKLIGTGVTFFLTGTNSLVDFQSGTVIDLEAPQDGETAGLLFFEDRGVDHSFNFNPFRLQDLPEGVRVHRISSNNARNLLGTIYLSRSILLVDASAPVADGSAYTAIIVGRLWLKEGPVLVLNADLTDTDVPVPDGLIGTKPVLVN